MITTVSYEELDRMFYERLRLAVVAAGVLPDITLYPNLAAWNTARANLKATLETQHKLLVDVIGVGAWDDRDDVLDARIVINRGSNSPGSIGGFPATFYERYADTDGKVKFKKSYYPDSSDNVAYEIRLLSNDIKMERIMSSILDNALGRRRYVQTVNESGAFTDTRVLLVNTGSFDLSERRFLEKGYKYTIQDVFLQSPLLIKDNIPVLSTVGYSVYLPDSATPENFEIVIVPEVVIPPVLTGLPYILPFSLQH